MARGVMRQKKRDVGTGDTHASPSSLPDAVEQVNGALLRLIKNYAGEFSAIAQEAGTPPNAGLNLAGVELDGIHYMLMKIGAAALGPLTDRQREIVLSVSEGLSNKEVGSRLDITPATVAAHLRVIYKKLKVDSRSGLLLRLFAEQNSSASHD